MEHTHRFIDGFAVPNFPARSISEKTSCGPPVHLVHMPSGPGLHQCSDVASHRDTYPAPQRAYLAPYRADSTLSIAATVQGDMAVDQATWGALPCDEDEDNFAEIAFASLRAKDGFCSAWAADCSPPRKVESWRDFL